MLVMMTMMITMVAKWSSNSADDDYDDNDHDHDDHYNDDHDDNNGGQVVIK